MASVSIFAFIDKEGIVTESQKYIDEIVLIRTAGQKQTAEVLNLQHNTLIRKEDKIYEFEEKSKLRQNIDSLKALGLAFMFAKNPKLEDSQAQLEEMFLMNQIIIDNKEGVAKRTSLDNSKVGKMLAQESGFQFHKILKQQTETHQDCLCSLARHIGHTERSF